MLRKASFLSTVWFWLSGRLLPLFGPRLFLCILTPDQSCGKCAEDALHFLTGYLWTRSSLLASYSLFSLSHRPTLWDTFTCSSPESHFCDGWWIIGEESQPSSETEAFKNPLPSPKGVFSRWSKHSWCCRGIFSIQRNRVPFGTQRNNTVSWLEWAEQDMMKN